MSCLIIVPYPILSWISFIKFFVELQIISAHESSSSLKMSSRKTAGRRGTTKKRAQRATSNVFAMFNQDQIQEFKEAFNMIDQVHLTPAEIL